MRNFQKQNNDLIKKHGIVDDKGQVSMIGAPTENVLAFNDAMSALVEEETTIPYEPIIWSKLGEDAHKKLTIADVRNLGTLLVEDETAIKD
jgi:hypothetical protein